MIDIYFLLGLFVGVFLTLLVQFITYYMTKPPTLQNEDDWWKHGKSPYDLDDE